jgi:hypothetical protein
LLPYLLNQPRIKVTFRESYVIVPLVMCLTVKYAYVLLGIV